MSINVNNILITEEDIKTLFDKFSLNITVNDINLYIISLTHKSCLSSIVIEYKLCNNIEKYINQESNNILFRSEDNYIKVIENSNERLEFCGDSIIKQVIAKYLVVRYNEPEGFLTKLKSQIENRKTLSHFARILGLDNFLIISKQNEEIYNRDSDRFLEDAFESFIGALCFDQSLEFCDIFLTILLDTEIDYAQLLYIDTNFKDKIQRYYHQNNWGHPKYIEISSSNIILNKKVFTVALVDNNNIEIVRTEETTKKKAEQKCAMFALLKYNLISEDQIVNEFN